MRRRSFVKASLLGTVAGSISPLINKAASTAIRMPK